MEKGLEKMFKLEKNSEVKDLFIIAYKKLKSHAYYEKRNIYLKEIIAKFEYRNKYNIESMDKSFEDLASSVIDNTFKMNDKHMRLRTLPKNIIDPDKRNNENIITNNVIGENSYIDKIIHFYDIDIELQIIGVVWILLVGKILEDEYKDFAAGNILDDKMKYDNLKLFKPYHIMYDSWRNDALEIVESRTKEEKRTLMVSLDIKEYFYSISLTEEFKEEIYNKYKKHIEDKNLKDNFECFKKVNEIVFKVIEKYSQEIKEQLHEKDDINRLPIGFLPSNILGNWYLKEFDRNITQALNPIYYKRYVDDMLIVLNAEYVNVHDDKIKSYIFNDQFCKKNIMEKAMYFINDNGSNEIISLKNKKQFEECLRKIKREDINTKINLIKCILRVYSDKDSDNFNGFLLSDKVQDSIYLNWDKDKIFEDLVSLVTDNKEFVDYSSNELFNQLINEISIDEEKVKTIHLINNNRDKTKIVIQDSKVKIYDFKKNGSTSLIKNFKEEISKNISVFRFLPERDEVLNSFDSEVYKLEYKDSIHKLSGIDDIKINTYNLSKFLARIIYSDKLEDYEYTKDVDTKILDIFNSPATIKYYFLWDKVFNYFMLNRNYKNVINLIIFIHKHINNIEVKIDSSLINKLKENSDIKEALKKDLKDYLRIIISLNYAFDDKLFNKILNKIDITENESKESYEQKFDNEIMEYISNKCRSYGQETVTVDYKNIYILKEAIRRSNMINHSLVRSPLINYCYNNYLEYINQKNTLINVDFLHENTEKPGTYSDMKSCRFANEEYKNSLEYYVIFKGNSNDNEKATGCRLITTNDSLIFDKKKIKCKKDLDDFSKKFNPRVVHMHECILYFINKQIGQGKIVSKCSEIKDAEELYNELNGFKQEIDNFPKEILVDEKVIIKHINKDLEYNAKNILKKIGEVDYLKYIKTDDYLFLQKERVINVLVVNNRQKKEKIKIAVINMKVNDNDLENSFKKIVKNTGKRLENLYSLLNQAIKEKAEMIVFPEVSIPFELLGVIANFSRKHDVAIICGLEHIIYDNKLCCNYIATILPNKIYNSSNNDDYYSTAIIKLRLKNHYSPKEKEWVQGYGWNLPSEKDFEMEYDLMRWKGIDFSSFSCFELANIKDRALFISHIDMLIGSVHNKDINYYSNIIESLSRDIHCYCVHVNDSTLGDSRIVKPASTNEKNILQISGGLNDTLLVGEVNIRELREFQILDHNLQLVNNKFKAVPPEFDYINVKRRLGLPL